MFEILLPFSYRLPRYFYLPFYFDSSTSHARHQSEMILSLHRQPCDWINPLGHFHRSMSLPTLIFLPVWGSSTDDTNAYSVLDSSGGNCRFKAEVGRRVDERWSHGEMERWRDSDFWSPNSLFPPWLFRNRGFAIRLAVLLCTSMWHSQTLKSKTRVTCAWNLSNVLSASFSPFFSLLLLHVEICGGFFSYQLDPQMICSDPAVPQFSKHVWCAIIFPLSSRDSIEKLFNWQSNAPWRASFSSCIRF